MKGHTHFIRSPRPSRRAQAALEFLTAYGWAIAVAILAILALGYFGVLAPERVLPNGCIANAPFNCTAYEVNGSGTRLDIRNTVGPLVDVSMSMSCSTSDGLAFANVSYGRIDPLQTVQPFFESCTSTGLMQGELTITYKKENERVPYTATGSVRVQ